MSRGAQRRWGWRGPWGPRSRTCGDMEIPRMRHLANWRPCDWHRAHASLKLPTQSAPQLRSRGSTTSRTRQS
eukprot:338448-Pleurochrysis_carterae.AAC.1